MFYLYPNEDTFTFYNSPEDLPEQYRHNLIEVEALPEGSGILRRASNGTFYYEPFPEPEVNPEQPIKPEPPVLSIEEMQAQILLNTEYLVSRAELGLGGI